MTHGGMTKYQRYPNNTVTLTTVPKVRLYVERPEEIDQWFVNIGHVTERGRWKTEPHAHPEYGQVIFVRSGRGVMNLEGSSVPFEGPCVLLLPTECVHGLDYETEALLTSLFLMLVRATRLEQIAFGLGLSDAAYFTRFFRKEVGQAPSQFRATARDQ